MPTLTLIDGSGFIFRAYHAIPHLSTTRGVPTNAVYGFTNMLLKSLREHDPTHVVLVFDAGRRSFRNDIDPQYKANRPEAPDDLRVQFPLVRDVARALRVPMVEEEGVEAARRTGAIAPVANPNELVLGVGEERTLSVPAGAQVLQEDNGVARVTVEGETVRLVAVSPGATSVVLVDGAGARTTWAVSVR